MANDRLMNAAQGDSIITALQTIAQKSESPYHSGNKLNPAYIDTGALADGMTATTQSTDDDSTKLATTAFVHDVVDTLPTPMVYKGTLGTGGTITTLPVDGSANIGDVYKVITAGTYTSQEAKIGDIFICHTKTSDSNTWDYIPTGDDVDVTEVSAGIGLTTQSGSTITTTGTIKAKLQNETKLGADATIVSDPGSLTTNIQPVLTDNSGNLAVKVDKSDVGLGNVTNDAQVKKINSSTSGNIVTWDGTDGATVSDSGKAIATTFANNANQIPTGAAITSGVTGTATMTGYTIDPSSSPAAITTSDTINEAIGKLEKTTSINKNNILYNTDNGAKNVLDFANLSKVGGSATVVKDDDSIAVTSIAASWSSAAYKLPILPAGTYTFSALVSNYNVSGGAARIIVTKTIGGQQEVGGKTLDANGKINFNFISDGEQLYLLYYPNYSTGSYANSFTASQNMLCTKAAWDISQTYQPYALSNAVITPALKECVDNGVKNLFQVTGTSTTGPGVTLTWNYSEGYVIVNGTSAPSSGTPAIYLTLGSWTASKDGYYVIASVNANSSDVLIYNDQTWATWETQTWNPVRYFTKGTTMTIFLRITAGTVCNNLKVYPMICTKAAWDTDPTYQPHALSNVELTSENEINKNNISSKLSMSQAYGYDTSYALSGTVDLDNLTTVGVYYYTAAAGTTITHAPTTSPFRMEVIQTAGAARYCQFMFTNTENALYFRNLVGSTWTGWYKIAATAV